MTRWERIAVDAICGRCGEIIPVNTAALVILIAAIKKPFIRCPKCAEQPVPPEFAVEETPIAAG